LPGYRKNQVVTSLFTTLERTQLPIIGS
jgi:hypothetical protein